MALITCPECGRQISDKSTLCLGCGIPMEEILKMLKHNYKSVETYEPENDTQAPTVGGLRQKVELIGNKQVKCLSCGTKYLASELKCPKCRLPMLVLYAKTTKVGRDAQNASEKTCSQSLGDKLIKCPVCKTEYWASISNCPRCQYPTLSILDNESEQQNNMNRDISDSQRDKYDENEKNSNILDQIIELVWDGPTIINKLFSTKHLEALINFKFKDNNKEYLVYTFNEKYTSDKEKIYINSVDRSSGKPLLRSTDDEEYKRVLQVIEEWCK